MDDYLKTLPAQGAAVYPVRISRDIDPACFLKIFQLLRKIKPALVHTHLIHGDTYGIAAAALAGVAAIVSTRHNDDTFRQTIALRALNRLVNRKISRVIAISDWVARFAHEVEAVPQGKIFTIHYGQAPLQPSRARESVRRELGFGPEHIVLGIIARLVPQKGHRCLLDAFSQASSRDSRLRLLIAGDGELRDSLQHHVSSLRLDGIVAFAGYRTDVPELLAGLDIFVHPSLWEGFGLAILEAMAMARPVIATKVSAIPELVKDGLTGLLVPPADSQSLAQAMLDLSGDELLRQKLGRAAHERWQNLFSVESMVTKTMQLYDTLCKDKGI
jgi:glycosyltransferase involved in cell wall biosynthesis